MSIPRCDRAHAAAHVSGSGRRFFESRSSRWPGVPGAELAILDARQRFGSDELTSSLFCRMLSERKANASAICPHRCALRCADATWRVDFPPIRASGVCTNAFAARLLKLRTFDRLLRYTDAARPHSRACATTMRELYPTGLMDRLSTTDNAQVMEDYSCLACSRNHEQCDEMRLQRGRPGDWPKAITTLER